MAPTTLKPQSMEWIPVTDTWTYASASTITIPTDGTTVYRKWMRIRFKQGGGFKYYVALTIASTLVTVVVNSDYTVANSAITDISYSFVDDPYGFPAYFNTSSSVLVNVTVGNGTLNSIYSIRGGIFKANINLTWAAVSPTSSIGGQIGYIPPIGMPDVKMVTYTTVGAAAVVDATVALYMCECVAHQALGRIELRVINVAGTYAVWAASSGTVPITMAASDLLTMEIDFILN